MLICWSLLTGDDFLPLESLRFTARLGFWALDPFYAGCFPADVSAVIANALLACFGSIQWGLVGIMVDLSRMWISRTPKTKGGLPSRLR
jgi:hypothetical protein